VRVDIKLLLSTVVYVIHLIVDSNNDNSLPSFTKEEKDCFCQFLLAGERWTVWLAFNLFGFLVWGICLRAAWLI
jgi:hypothetical protein